MYNTKLETFYNKDSNVQIFVTKDHLIKKLNSSKSMEEYEFIIKDINDSIYERKFLADMEKVQTGFSKNAIKQLAQDISTQVALKPQPAFALNANFDKLSAEIKDSVNLLLPQCFSLQNTINSISMSYLSWTALLDSKIMQNDLERAMVASWVSGGLTKFTLLYRGSRDGYSHQNFIDKVGSAKPTLTLVEAATNKRFGGFTDQDWSATGHWKTSSNSFIFSITDNDKYPIKQASQGNAILTHTDRLPMFGNGDIFLALNGNSNSSSNCNLGVTYDNKGKPNDSLAGTKNFQIKELEVYQVDLL